MRACVRSLIVLSALEQLGATRGRGVADDCDWQSTGGGHRLPRDSVAGVIARLSAVWA